MILPALNEEATIGAIVAEIRSELVRGVGLVDELLVVDSGSTDNTAAVARAAGARVLGCGDVLPRITAVVGKGEAMWRGVAATTGDIVVFIDADLESFEASHVTKLVDPLLASGGIDFVKAAYHRPVVASDHGSTGGGRVTELVARPLLNLCWPELAGLVQPLAGEYAVRRSVLEQLPFPCGYGVDFALLVDALRLRGPQAFAQVDLGTRIHRHQDDLRLGRMSAEIIQAAASRLGIRGPDSACRHLGTTLTQFSRCDVGFVPDVHVVTSQERPPLRDIPEYGEGSRLAVAFG